jgi:ferredoxin
MVPRSLRFWFVLHFVVDFIFAVPLLVAPVWLLTLFGFQNPDSFTARLVGAALLGIGGESLLSWGGPVEAFRAMLNLKIIWSLAAIVGIILTLVISGGPFHGLCDPADLLCLQQPVDLLSLPAALRKWIMSTKPKFIRPSTRAFFRERGNTPNYSFFDWLHGYVYARWPYLYIGIGKGDHPLAQKLAPLWNFIGRVWPETEVPESGSGTFADGYHGKVIPTETARQLVTINQEIHIDDLEQVVPYPKARAIILNNPDHIVALECPCRSAKENPCTPLDVCLIVGEPFASFVRDHHPERSRWLDAAEAQAILEAERARGHVSHAFFKDAMLGRFYAICNCCECCCGAMSAQRNGIPMLASSGYISQVDPDLCIGCGTCEEICPFHAITITDGYSVIDYNGCMGCGVCGEHCTEGAISLVRDDNKGVPLEINKLMEMAEAS